jgi:hypothetical protein
VERLRGCGVQRLFKTAAASFDYIFSKRDASFGLPVAGLWKEETWGILMGNKKCLQIQALMFR